RWEGKRGHATLILTGLALNDLNGGDVTVELDRDDARWTASSPAASAWQTIGTLSLAGPRIELTADDRTGGAWLLLKGRDGATIKIAGAWSVPNVPERAALEVHRLPAAPLLMILGVPPMDGRVEADLSFTRAQDPPLTGRLTVSDGQWGAFPFDLVEVRGAGTPGRGFEFSAFRVSRGEELAAGGAGSLVLYPERELNLTLSVERLQLGYLSPLGFVTAADATALGKIVVSGDPENPALDGSLLCSPGAVTPSLGCSKLALTAGRLDFTAHHAALTASLHDLAGAPVVVTGTAEHARLLLKTFALSISAPSLVLLDALPGLYRGGARGRVTFEGSPAAPTVRGEVTLENGRLQSPPKRQDEGGDTFAKRLDWDVAVKFGREVQYALAPVDLAKLSSRSAIRIKGRGDAFRVYGEVYADSGPLTLFLGKDLYKNPLRE
ncbi:MAG: hypothetical protein AAB368_12155, partial [bacterium]